MHLSQPIRNGPRVQRPVGFTLLEVLLTLAVLAAIAALVVPMFGDLLADRRLARGGEVVRVEMTRARLEAMRSGRTQMMRIQLGTGEFAVQPWYSAEDMTETAEMTGSGAALLSGGTPMAAPNLPPGQMQQPVESETLPEGITFADVRVEATARSMVVQMQSGTAVASATQDVPGSAQPILFYADGTTSTAAVTVIDQTVGRVTVALRGLTGEATPSEIMP